MGGGSLGGKARGLAFVRRLLAEQELRERFPGVEIAVPVSAVVGTDVFDRFLDENELRQFAIECEDEAEVERRFQAARFPEQAERDVAAFLERARFPLAVRSSSLLEDSQHQPFTGVYDTLMLANNAWSLGERLDRALAAIKQVYASSFSRHAKAYLKATSYRLEEEKMAVILQRIVGRAHGPRFYPDFSGVARSHNFYPAPPLSPEDGVAAVALGMGRTVVEGEECLLFCPRDPQHLLQFSTVEDILKHSQRGFWALDLGPDGDSDMRETRFGLEVAEADGTLYALGSTYSAEAHAVYDGLSRPGVRLVSFAPVLKHGVFPLGEVLTLLLQVGQRGMNRPAEIEFAVRLSQRASEPHEFGFLQMRPLTIQNADDDQDLGAVDSERLLARSPTVLGNGTVALHDVVFVDSERYERAGSREVAQAIARYNAELTAEERPFLLIGVGRWGSADPWLGIPVTWEQIAGARVIVETGFRDFRVTPSQGSHFFQNLTSFQVGYFTVNAEVGEGFVRWDWLAQQPAESARGCVTHLRLSRPVVVQMNGRRNQGVIYKPGQAPGQ
jgi:hypothetical protein